MKDGDVEEAACGEGGMRGSEEGRAVFVVYTASNPMLLIAIAIEVEISLDEWWVVLVDYMEVRAEMVVG